MRHWCQSECGRVAAAPWRRWGWTDSASPVITERKPGPAHRWGKHQWRVECCLAGARTKASLVLAIRCSKQIPRKSACLECLGQHRSVAFFAQADGWEERTLGSRWVWAALARRTYCRQCSESHRCFVSSRYWSARPALGELHSTHQREIPPAKTASFSESRTCGSGHGCLT